MREKFKSFLDTHNMFIPDAVESAHQFYDEACRCLEADKPDSFPMIPLYIKVDGIETANKKIIVIDAGGTNLRIALVKVDENLEVTVERMDNYPMLGTDSEISIQEFFDKLAQYLIPFLDQTKLISFVFSFPYKSLPDLDGEIMLFDKEIRITGAGGHHIAKDLNDSIRKLGYSGDNRIIVLNDTTTTLMGGTGIALREGCESTIGVIIGTGINIAYIQNKNGIKKCPEIAAQSGKMVINMEAANYAGFPRSNFDVSVQSRTMDPEWNHFEKMVSGAYQGSVVEEMLRTAASENIFSEKTNEALMALSSLRTMDVDAYVRNRDGDNPIASAVSECDRQDVYDLIDFYYERTACLISSAMAGTVLLYGEGNAPRKPVCIVIDGSTYYKSMLLKGKVERTFGELAEELGLKYIFAKIDDGNITGAAVSMLMND